VTRALSTLKYIPYIIAIFVSLFFFLFHFHHMQQFLDWDQIVYANNIINSLKSNSYVMYYTHHLHNEIGGKFFHELVSKYLGRKGLNDVVFNNRMRSVIAACIGIFFAVLFIYDITGKVLWGLIGGILIGFCHGYLTYATKIDTAIFPAAGMILILWILNKIEKAGKWSILLTLPAGIILALGVMFHQYMGFACIIFIITLAFPPYIFLININLKPYRIVVFKKKSEIERSPRRRYITIALVALIGIILIGVGYFYAGETVYNLPFSKSEKRRGRGPLSNQLFQKWIMGYAVMNSWGKGIKNFNPKNPFYGYTRSFLIHVPKDRIGSYDYRYYYNLRKPVDKTAFTHNQLAYFTAIALLGTILFLPFMWNRYKRSFLFILLSTIVFSVFTTYWEAHYYEFWLIPCLMVCILAILLLNLAGEKLSFILKGFSQYPFMLYIIFFTIIIAFHNITYCAVPYSRNRILGSINKNWHKNYYMKLFSRSIYNFPDNPYKNIYKKGGKNGNN